MFRRFVELKISLNYQISKYELLFFLFDVFVYELIIVSIIYSTNYSLK